MTRLPTLLLTAFLFSAPAIYAENLQSHQANQSKSQSQSQTDSKQLSAGLKAYDHKDWSSAYQYLMPLAEKGNAKAMGRIGSLYRDGKGGVQQSYEEAMWWYRKAADKGDGGFSENNLAFMYEHGTGVEQDYKEAFAWYMDAAQKGDARAQSNVAEMYQNGTGVKQNYKEAMAWYLDSAKKGNSVAQNNLGGMYHDGKGVEKNHKQAEYWYRKAIKQGNEKAKENLDDLLNPKSYYIPPSPTVQSEAERYEQIRADGCAMSNYGCNRDIYGGKY